MKTQNITGGEIPRNPSARCTRSGRLSLPDVELVKTPLVTSERAWAGTGLIAGFYTEGEAGVVAIIKK